MSFKTLLKIFIPSVFILSWMSATATEKTDNFFNKVSENYNKVTQTAVGLKPYIDMFGGNSDALVALSSGTPMTRNPTFPECQMAPTVPPIAAMCSDSVSTLKDQLTGENLVVSTNTKVITHLMGLQRMYLTGSMTFANEGSSNYGPACLTGQKKRIEKEFQNYAATLDNILKDKMAKARDLEEEFAEKKALIEADYNLLFTGKNDNFDLNAGLLAQPGCESMLEADGLENSYNSGGLINVKKDAAARNKDATAFGNNARKIQGDLEVVLNNLKNNIQSKTIDELVNDDTITGRLAASTTDLSQYNLTGTKGFSNSLKTSITDTKIERDSIINSFKGYLGNDKYDQDLLNTLNKGGDTSNKTLALQNWQNAKKLNCVYATVKTSDVNSFKEKLYSMAAPKNMKGTSRACGSDPKGCKKYVDDVLTQFSVVNENSGQTSVNFESLETRISRIAAKTNSTIETVWTFSDGSRKMTLADLLGSITKKCNDTMTLKEASFKSVVKTMTKAIKALEKQEKKLKNDIMDRMRNEILECSGKAISYQTCGSVLPSADSSFCFKQSATCAGNIRKCQKHLDIVIKDTTDRIEINAGNMNAKVSTFKALLYDELKSYLSTNSDFVKGTMTILSRWAGYTSPEFNLDKVQDEYIKDFDQLQVAPMNIKIIDPAKMTVQFKENIKAIKDQNEGILDKITTKMDAEISAIEKNYGTALATINKALEQCNVATSKLNEKVSKMQEDQCTEKSNDSAAEEQISGVLDKISDYADEYSLCNDNGDLLRKIISKTASSSCTLSYKYSDIKTACSNINREKELRDKKERTEPEEKEMGDLKVKLNGDMSKVSSLHEKLMESLKKCKSKELKTNCMNTFNEMGKKPVPPKPEKEKKKETETTGH